MKSRVMSRNYDFYKKCYREKNRIPLFSDVHFKLCNKIKPFFVCINYNRYTYVVMCQLTCVPSVTREEYKD